MAWFYIEVFRTDASQLEGHFFKLFPDGITPPIPESPRLARGEVSDKTYAQVRAFLKSGIGKIKLGAIPAGIRNTIKTTRTFSFTAAEIAPFITKDRDLTAVTTRKMELIKDLPSKPAGTVFVKEADGRYRCVGDVDTWFEDYIVEAAAAPVPIPPTAAQGLVFQEF